MTTAGLRGEVLMYAEKPARVSRLAVVSLGAAVVGAVVFFLVVPTVVALVLGIVAGWRIRRNPMRLGGVGFANAAVTTSLCAFCLTLVALVAMPSLGRSRPYSWRSYCAANLRGIVQSVIVYSNDNNDRYPVVTYSPYSAALNSPTARATEATADDAVKSLYKTPFPQAGSVTASLWILVLRNQCSPKQFLCKSDPTPITTGFLQAPGGNFYDNFQNGTQISYSAAYPWKGDGTVGKWWMNTTDASLPLMADIAPENGTGSPPADLLSPTAAMKARNSVNHQRDGQNIAFADCHTEFDKRPDVGQRDDNIWTASGRPSTGPAQFGGVAAGRFSPMLTRDAAPFDVVMYPIRNVATGGM